VLLRVRYFGEKFVVRFENEWLFARMQWMYFYFDSCDMRLSPVFIVAE